MFRLIIAFSFLCLISASPILESDNRIVNGRQASIHEQYYVCSLQKAGSHFCGAIILNEWQCLTAAHCFNKLTPADIPLLKVRCGSLQWNSGGALRNVESYIKHENFDRISMDNDVAILNMQYRIAFNNQMGPIKLASETPIEGIPLRVSGWGRLQEGNTNRPTMMQTTDLISLSKQTCSSNKYKYGNDITGKMVCAFGPGTDACQGDSGGPLVDDFDTLVGIVSWGRGCAEDEYPGVYSDVAQLKSWIENHTRQIGHSGSYFKNRM